ncbi:MAG TPA: amidohydrolase family protein [Acidimicrobiia bacterium]|nr:amidohydrolase family protein [Acidimicrobiia bacterium]
MTYHDHHIHPIGYATLVNGLELMDSVDLADLTARVARFADTVEGAVIGHRLNDEGLAEGRLPTRDDLDDVVGDRPTLLYRYCGHIAVANSAALSLAGVESGTPDPEGGSFDRDPTGEPTGVLRETAIQSVSSALAPLVDGPSDAAILRAFGDLAAMGLGSITGIVSAGEPLWCGVTDELDVLCRLAPDLPIDVDVLVIAPDPQLLAEAAEKIRRSQGRVRFLGWKEFADGSFGGHTAALHDPFTDRPDTRGTERLDREHATMMARAAMMLGGTVAVHAIGDRANDAVLDLFEDLVDMGADPTRLRVEHASLLTAAAVERMARLGVTASVQPAFLASEGDWLVKRIGDERMRRVYPFRSLIQAGIQVIGGSDSPVELPDPTIGINAAIGRPGFDPSEGLTPDEAAALFAPPARF